MVIESVPDHPGPTGSPEDWIQWALNRLHKEPWALGGVVVIGIFVLVTLSLVMFALLYGCCCTPNEKGKMKKMKRKAKNGVL